MRTVLQFLIIAISATFLIAGMLAIYEGMKSDGYKRINERTIITFSLIAGVAIGLIFAAAN